MDLESLNSFIKVNQEGKESRSNFPSMDCKKEASSNPIPINSLVESKRLPIVILE